MEKNELLDRDIFDALRVHGASGKLSQLIVDITKKAISDDEFRLEIAERLGIVIGSIARTYDISPATILKIYPTANIAALPYIMKYAPEYGIVSKKQMAAFIATCLIESNGFSAKRENFNYRPERLLAVFPKSRIPNLSFAKNIVAQGQVALANHLYGSRFGNRPGTNDGWDYRGGGIIQNTFRSNYYKLQVATGIPFGDNPKLIEDLENSVIAAMAYWQERGINAMADKINTYANGYTLNTLNSRGVETRDYEMNYGARIVREAVNGGLNGYTDFCRTLEKCLQHM